jgi:hypothetical protein
MLRIPTTPGCVEINNLPQCGTDAGSMNMINNRMKSKA